MPVHFIDNYSRNNLENEIKNSDGKTLHGEIWLYNQFFLFNQHNLLPDEKWYLKHNYNLSTHPSSKGKIEGQIDFLLLSKDGILIIEVKGGGIRVDENDCYYSFSNKGEYQAQNPFVQVKEYVHSLKELIDSSVFIYRAVIFPHETGFELKGPQLMGYRDFFFSKKNIQKIESQYAKNKTFFEFIKSLGRRSRRHNIKQLFPLWPIEKVEGNIYETHTQLNAKELRRLKSELFPVQSSYGYNPDRINSELILNENFEILKGLRRNKNVMIQGAPGTGKTIIATKYLAENLLKQQKGIMFCANKLVRAKLEFVILNEYEFDPNFIQFRIFSEKITTDNISEEIDFLVFDEAQEYFDKGLYDFIGELNIKLDNPKILILYDPDQSIISNFKELSWYTNFFQESGYTHYYFDEMYRCIQNKKISEMAEAILKNKYSLFYSRFLKNTLTCGEELEKLEVINALIKQPEFTTSEKVFLVQSHLLDEFKSLTNDFFKKELLELSESNINVPSEKIRYTTPIKYRGLENKCIFLVTKEFSIKTKTQNFVGITRAMESLTVIIWK